MKTKKILSMLLACAALLMYSCNKPAPVTDDASGKSEANKECMKKVFAMFETGKYDGIEDCVAENIIEHSPAPGITTNGIQGLKDAIVMNHAAFPDMKITVLALWQEGDVVIGHYNMKGTNSGAMGNMSATNKTIDMNAVDIVRFENGKGAEHWGYWEEGKMMQQLGMMPPHDAMPADTSKKM